MLPYPVKLHSHTSAAAAYAAAVEAKRGVDDSYAKTVQFHMYCSDQAAAKLRSRNLAGEDREFYEELSLVAQEALDLAEDLACKVFRMENVTNRARILSARFEGEVNADIKAGNDSESGAE